MGGDDRKPVTVLYIGGDGRSGSTVLASLLASWEDMISVGELRGIWNALRDNELCTCGSVIRECAFWGNVGDRAFGGWEHAEYEAMIRSDSLLARHRRFPRLLLASLAGRESMMLRSHREKLANLYRAVRDVSGRSVVVDSTKNPGYALLLRDVAGVEVRFVHLVRDSRAVAFSWGKAHVEQPEYEMNPLLKGTLLEGKGLLRSAIEWDVKNIFLHLVGRSAPHCLVRYESLMDDPRRELRGIARLFADLTTAACDPEPAVDLRSLPLHMIGGNRLRFKREVLVLRGQREWLH